MLQRLTIALAQVKPGNNSEDLLDEIRQTVYSLYQLKQITKKVYNNIIKSIRLQKWILYLRTWKSTTSEPHVVIFRLTDKLVLRRGEKNVSLSNCSIYYTWKNKKSPYNKYIFKISAPTCSDKFKLPDGSYSVSHIQEYFEYIKKKHHLIIHLI